jgi:RNA polymerase sigma factor (sigma-70 family)
VSSIERGESGRAHADSPQVGEESAASLVEEFDGLARLAWLLSGDQSRSEDAAAEAIARVWQRDAAAEIEQLRPYLRRTLINIVTRNRRRSSSEQRALESPARSGGGLLDSAAAERIDVHEALLLLPLDQRVVIALRYFEDWSEEMIASTLGIPPGTVKSRASRGLEALRANLRGVSGD